MFFSLQIWQTERIMSQPYLDSKVYDMKWVILIYSSHGTQIVKLHLSCLLHFLGEAFKTRTFDFFPSHDGKSMFFVYVNKLHLLIKQTYVLWREDRMGIVPNLLLLHIYDFVLSAKLLKNYMISHSLGKLCH